MTNLQHPDYEHHGSCVVDEVKPFKLVTKVNVNMFPMLDI